MFKNIGRVLLNHQIRCFTLTAVKDNASQTQLLSRLRKKTGFPMSKCKSALKEHDYDFEKAEAWLKGKAQEEGWEKASKVQDRPMSHGLIGLLTEKNSSVMIEVNCETDFVARNDRFQSLVKTLTRTCFKNAKNQNENKVLWDREAVNLLKSDDGSRTLADLVATEIGMVGENMAITRAAFLRAESGEYVGKYAHTLGAAIVKNDECLLGKYGALVLCKADGEQSKGTSLAEIGRELAQHVVGMNPTSIGEYPPPEDSGSGNSKKKKKETAEESRMLYQEFLMDADIIVGEFLQEQNVKLLDFVRYECGELAEH